MNNEISNTTLFVNIRNLLEGNRKKIKKTVNQVMVATYWDMGRLIVEDEQQGKGRAEYGKKLLQVLSEQLTIEFGKGFDVTNLRRMRAFYVIYPIRDTLCLELSWSHYRHLIRIDNQDARNWYTQECLHENWSVRSLERQISTQNYERLLTSQDKNAVRLEARELTKPLAENARGVIRDPYVLEFLGLQYSSALESNIEQALMDNLQKFILELGAGFAFVERQQRISTEDQDFYIDLVFYNFKLKRFLLIDLKIGKLNHQDVGQMDTYVRMYDQLKIQTDDKPTIGLILCSEKSEAVAKYSVLVDSEQLFASKYLPSVEQLKSELLREREIITAELERSE